MRFTIGCSTNDLSSPHPEPLGFRMVPIRTRCWTRSGSGHRRSTERLSHSTEPKIAAIGEPPPLAANGDLASGLYRIVWVLLPRRTANDLSKFFERPNSGLRKSSSAKLKASSGCRDDRPSHATSWRQSLYRGCRTLPSADFARYSISASSSGSTQMPLCAIRFV
jgi:hypothetical protein